MIVGELETSIPLGMTLSQMTLQNAIVDGINSIHQDDDVMVRYLEG